MVAVTKPSKPRRLPSIVRFWIFVVLANMVSLPMPSEMPGSVVTLLFSGAATLLVGSWVLARGLARQARTFFLLTSCFGILVVLLQSCFSWLSSGPGYALVVKALLDVWHLLVQLGAFTVALADFGPADCRSIIQWIPGLSREQKEKIAIQLWLPWFTVAEITRFVGKEMTARHMRPGPRANPAYCLRSWRALGHALQVELMRTSSRLEYRMFILDEARATHD